MKQLLVIGNGFDLQCGLKSNYNDFFSERFKEVFDIDDFKDCKRAACKITNYIEKNGFMYEGLNKKIDYFHGYKLKRKKEGIEITRWDCFFLFSQVFLEDTNNLQWQGVENIIYNVVSIALDPSFESNLEFKHNSESDDTEKEKYYKAINYLSTIGDNSPDTIATELLNDLNQFEEIFADYIVKQVLNNRNFQDFYPNLLSRLIKNLDQTEEEKPVNVDVISFNYSLTLPFKEKFNRDHGDKVHILSWSNIHGVAFFKDSAAEQAVLQSISYVSGFHLPAPIFGIDNHDILSDGKQDDPRIIFTKSFRLIDNNVNIIRDDMSYENIDLITIYGHSLARADYSYFETIFDNCDIYSSKTKLEFYYHPGDHAQLEKRKAVRKVVNLLTDYGNTLDGRHGENIVNKMILENRLQVIDSTTL
ncbi:AbiH family protein [Xylocopilactobacillus apis]|uniref:Bacteriophage abortive infection AbiH n=1 Tax=Xylocopilactobacillus apis TaxID=2932183 RepID=A0AAU9D168_9LACO|nr:AbiH family protein [Xylocopilactobacillus apis]BDR57444.1 hypothetical protein KIMC2_20060 [Xylocopilactobacillus apis]